VGPIATSALTGLGVELIERMKAMIPWDDKPRTVTTTTFKRIKDYVSPQRSGSGRQTIVTPEELAAVWRPPMPAGVSPTRDADAVGHLENYGYVKRLRTRRRAARLLQPERLNNMASSFVLEARRNPKGLGALEEKRFWGDYAFPELRDLNAASATCSWTRRLAVLEHHVCFRETTRCAWSHIWSSGVDQSEKAAGEDQATEEGVAYTVSGPMENVFASLVVLLGYTHTFTRTNQWQNNAR